MNLKWTSAKVRETFIQYFVRNATIPHTFVPSSSIVPRNDPSLAFVNAGMNQFKDVILGYGRPKFPTVTNSQKCLRINDLRLVGADTYHHTFFEMLGNWSFSNYFKKEACGMAWDLLTKDYGLDPNRLFVTYYAGGGSVPVDKETKAIWESIGVKPDRILPFGPENFWQMGPVGPCGPSTEIHYDHRGPCLPPSAEINGDSGLIVEIWNLVFMQYNKRSTGELERLPLSHVVDTGAGLERLCAVLNEKTSNYDTDLFQPIFGKIKDLSKIAKYTGDFAPEAERDRSYRIFADHMRAVTVALSDGILPQTNHKIRKLIQRALAVSDQQFETSSLSTSDRLDFLMEAGINQVCASLSETFPEMEKMKQETSQILNFEIQRYTDFAKMSSKAKHSEIPSITLMDFPALARIPPAEIIQARQAGKVDGTTAYKWYESCGATAEAIEDLCSAIGLNFDQGGMEQEMKRMKKKFREEVAAEMMANEDGHFIRKLESLMALYNPEDSGGVCQPGMNIAQEPSPGVFVQWIFDGNGDPVEEIATGGNESYWLILNKTPFVPGTSNFETDRGVLFLKNGVKLNVDQVRRLPSGWILHLIKNVPEIGLGRKAVVRSFEIQNDIRFGREMSANAVSHVAWWLQKRYGVVRIEDEAAQNKTCQMNITILEGQGDFTLQDIHKMQNDLNGHGVPVVVTKKLNPSKKTGYHELVMATGLSAEICMRHGQEVLDCLTEIQELSKECTSGEDDPATTKAKEVLKVLVDRISECVKRPDLLLPSEVYQTAEKVLQEADKILWKSQEQSEISRMTDEITKEALQPKGSPFLLKLFTSDHEFSSLKKITRVAEQQQKPILLLIRSSEDDIQGRCSVPKSLSGAQISADEWMKCVTKELGKGVVAAPKGQDGRFQVNLKRIRIYDCHERLSGALITAKMYIQERIDKKFIDCGSTTTASTDTPLNSSKPDCGKDSEESLQIR